MTTAIPDILARIVEHKRNEISVLPTGIDALEEAAAGRTPRSFSLSLTANSPAVIAEIKQASPSKGILVEGFDPVMIAAQYQAGGAAALSVLTDARFFRGSLEDLQAARAAVQLPVLRKDFTIARVQIAEAAASGADAILLIVAILSDAELRDFREYAERLSLDALVEVHDAQELDRAVGSGARIIGVNNRDLRTFDVRLETSLTLADRMPAGVVKVSESGIHSGADVARLRSAGFSAFLVGEHLMKWGRGTGNSGTARMMVKICGITSAEDAAVAVEAGASAIGFNFYRLSPRYVSPELARRIGESLPGGVLKVGIFVDEDGSETAAVAGLDVAQVYGSASAGSLRRWRACRAGTSLDDDGAEAFLLDTPSAVLHGGTGESFDWSLARGLGRRIILAGGLDASNVQAAIAAAEPWGVDACSRLESSPGRKDARKVREFVKAALNL